MSHSKNNFRDPAIQKKRKYRLWVCHTPEAVLSGRKHTFLYFSYNKPDGGLECLKNKMNRDRKLYLIAILYDNITNQVLIKWDHRKPKRKKNKSVKQPNK